MRPANGPMWTAEAYWDIIPEEKGVIIQLPMPKSG